MYCSNCGTKIEEGAQFCHNCGRKPDSTINTTSQQATSIPLVKGVDVFYSEEWLQKKVFAIASLPYFDVMVDKQYLYIIQMPKYGGATLGLIIGLVFFQIIGAFIGAYIGGSSDAKKRSSYRSTWINSERKLISRDYSKDVFMKVPLENLKGNIIFQKSRFAVSYEEKKIVLDRKRAGSFRGPDRTETDKLFKSIESYVLRKLWK